MGASGAGKSTLLGRAGGQEDYRHCDRRHLAEWQAVRGQVLQPLGGVREQFDSHNALSTVKEPSPSALCSACDPHHQQGGRGGAARDARHAAAGLSHSANDIIGSPGYGGVSPEVRRSHHRGGARHGPALLFLDESTHSTCTRSDHCTAPHCPPSSSVCTDASRHIVLCAVRSQTHHRARQRWRWQ